MEQYLLSVHYVEGQPPPPPEQMQEMFHDVDAFNKALQAEGAYIYAGGLREPDTSAVVHVKGGDVLVTDGPFPEAKEQIGGFWIVRAADRDAALALAERASRACQGPVEVRPFQDEVDETEVAAIPSD